MKNLLLILGLFFPTAGFTQQYSIDWQTIDSGGGTSSNSQFVVCGTIGQPDAGGPLAGGSYSVTGGFWSLLQVVQTPGAPLLLIRLTSTNTAVVAWPAPATGFALQWSATLEPASWQAVTETVRVVGAENQIIVSPPAGKRFYRLRPSQ